MNKLWRTSPHPLTPSPKERGNALLISFLAATGNVTQAYILLFFIFISLSAFAQNDSVSTPSKITVKGYIKYLEELNIKESLKDALTNGLIHNRLNFRYDPNQYLNFRLEVRNRIYFGELVRSYPGFASFITAYNGTYDLSKNWVNNKSVLFNTAVDRALAEYNKNKWDITIGRQRINWGINTVWTPNDIFNTFNYFDFDYEERPGSDAARIQYAFTSLSSLELAVSPGKSSKQTIAALMYRTNKWDYDFQLFSGIYQQDFTAGGGWAGNIKEAGFKGEISYFTPYNNFSDTNSIAASLSLDYGFKNGVYVLISGLYNSNGTDSIPNIAQFTNETLSAKNIFPFKFTCFAQATYPFTPIFKGSLGVMYSPASTALIFLPNLSYSIADNWVIDLIAQSFFAEQNNHYNPVGTAAYLRLKWGW
jgi:hypothetical protein